MVVAHCVLNQNSRVRGTTHSDGMINEIVTVLIENGVGVIQMPCPELTYAGLLRNRQTKEQYDTRAYRKHCKHIASSTADQIEEYSSNNFRVIGVLGISGSPTCGVNATSLTKARGILVEELQTELKKRKVAVSIRDVNLAHAGKDAIWLENALTK